MRGLRLEPDGPGRWRVSPDEPGLQALLLEGTRGAARPAAPPEALAAAWRSGDGATRVRWSASGAEGALETGAAPRHAVLLPAATALLAGLRRAGAEMGERCLVPGEGIAAALGRAAAADTGGRILERADETARGAARPSLAIAVEAARLADILPAVAEGGRVVVVAEPALLPGLDFYPHVHRRGLTLVIAPPRPAPDEAADLWARGRRRLERLVESAAAACGGSPGVAAGPDEGWTLPEPARGWAVHYKEG